MAKTAHEFTVSPHLSLVPESSLKSHEESLGVSPQKVFILLEDFDRYVRDYLFDCQYSEKNQSQATIDGKRNALDKLKWLCQRRGYDRIGAAEFRQFMAHVTSGHKEPGGRWGNPQHTEPASERTVQSYFIYARGFFKWLAVEEIIPISPLDRTKMPKAESVPVKPFTEDQLQALIAAARRSQHPKRDVAILLFMLDTGVRASELCNLKMGDIDFKERCVNVFGKGRKPRVVFFQRRAAKAIWQCVSEKVPADNEPVFRSDSGILSGEALTRSGLLQLYERLGKQSKIRGVRCSPHTMRHTCAINFLMNGGQPFALQAMLGHKSLHQTNEYVHFAKANLQEQHREFSPADRMKL